MLNHVWLFVTPWAIYCLPVSSVHGIFQARILKWVAISFPRGSSQPRDQTHVSHIAGRRLYIHKWFCTDWPIYFETIYFHISCLFCPNPWEEEPWVIHWIPSTQWKALEKEMATHSSILAWRISWAEEPGGLQSLGSQRVGQDWVTNSQWEVW